MGRGRPVSLCAQNSVLSGGGMATSFSKQWGDVLFSWGPQTGSSGTVHTFLRWGRSYGKCGQCSCWLFSSKVFIVATSRTASMEHDKHLVHPSSLTILPCSSSALFVWALGVLMPLPSSHTLPCASFQLHGKATSPVGRSKHESSPFLIF